MLDNNPNLEALQLSGCNDAVDDGVCGKIASLANLSMLDLSRAKQVTDEGLGHFENKKLPLQQLCVNGMTGISSVGLNFLIGSCTETLFDLEAAYLD